MKIDKMNEGVIFLNEKQNENQPDYTGNLNVLGRQVRIACWKKVSKSGKNMMSCKITDEDSNKGDVTAYEVQDSRNSEINQPF